MKLFIAENVYYSPGVRYRPCATCPYHVTLRHVYGKQREENTGAAGAALPLLYY